MFKGQGYNIFLGAFASLASYALFHLVTIFPLSWLSLQSTQSVNSILTAELFGGVLAIVGTILSGWMADRLGRRNTLGGLACLIGVFALCTPLLLEGGPTGQDAFIIIGFFLLGLSYGQAAGTVTANFTRQFRYTGAAFTSDFAWLVGAAFAPLVALSLSSHFGVIAVSAYLLSGVVCTLLALRINRALETRAD